MMTHEPIIRLLAAMNLLPEKELRHLCLQRKDEFVNLLDELQMRFPSHKAAIGRIWADSLNVAYVDIENTRIESVVASRLDFDLSMREEVVAMYEFDGVVTLASSHPETNYIEERFRSVLNQDVSIVFSFPSQIIDAIEMAYQTQNSLTALIEQSGIREMAGKGGRLAPDQMRQLAGNEYVIKFVRGLILLALSERASDIHIEPNEKGVRIRFRIDGSLQDRFLLDSSVLDPIISRLKIMADLDITEHRLPLDGRIGLVLRENTLDLRFSSIPSVSGEKIVLRLLGRNKRRNIPDLEQLHFSATVFKDLQRVSHMPNGIFLVTGPTGSGKTTTLYALLKQINTSDVNILTAEDPVEYRLEGATQVQVNPAVGLDFSAALRSFLRQDPDVILVGEIRDAESGRIAAQAALTGHLVLSTMHTNSALQSVTRLIDIGVEPFLVAPSIIAVMAQRLVKQICPSCKMSFPAPQEMLDEHFVNTGGETVLLWKGAGCERCGNTGYFGRVAIHELFVINQEVRDLIARGASNGEINAAAVRTGFRSMRYDGMKKVLRGLTTVKQLDATACLEEDVR